LKRRRPSGAFLFLLCLEVACASRAASRPVSKPVPPSEAISGWTEEGLASWYGGDDGFEGKPTASGEIYDSSKMTAAHRDLPLGTLVRVTNLDNGKSVEVRVNDRGPFIHGRVIDLSQAAARRLDIIGPGVAPVRIVILSPGVAPTPVPPAVAAGPWAVQVGSFGEPDRATRHAERLRSAGFTVYLEPYDGLTRVKIGPLDRGNDPLVLLTLPAIDLIDRVGPHPRVMAEGLVADDRAEPLLATSAVTEGGAATPSTEQRVLGDVLRLVGIAGVVIGHAQAETVRLIPLPTVSLIRILNDRNVD